MSTPAGRPHSGSGRPREAGAQVLGSPYSLPQVPPPAPAVPDHFPAPPSGPSRLPKARGAKTPRATGDTVPTHLQVPSLRLPSPPNLRLLYAPPRPPRLPELRQLWLPCLEPSPHWCPGSTPKHMAARAVPVHELGHVPALIKASTGNKTQSPPGSGSPVSHLHLLPRSWALASRAASRSLCLRAFAHADPCVRLPIILTQTLLL